MSNATTDFGRDVWCLDSIKTGRFATGLLLVAQAAYRRLITPRGTLRGGEAEANYGLDLTSLCGGTNPKATAAAMPAKIRSELLKDERIQTVDVDVLSVTDGPLVTFTITITCVTAAGPFSLQLLASTVTVEVLGVAA